MDPAIQAAAQVVHVAAFVVLLNVEPATQAVQPLLTVIEHAVETRVPARQVLQAVQAAAFVVVL